MDNMHAINVIISLAECRLESKTFPFSRLFYSSTGSQIVMTHFVLRYSVDRYSVLLYIHVHWFYLSPDRTSQDICLEGRES